MVTRLGNRRPARWYLREWRLHRGLTQEQLSARLGTSKGQVSKLESGDKKWDQGWVDRIAVAFDFDDPLAIFRPPDAPTADDLLRNASPEQREQAIRVLRAMLADASLAKAV